MQHVCGLIRYITCRLLRCIIPLYVIQDHLYGLIHCITCGRRNIIREGSDGGATLSATIKLQ